MQALLSLDHLYVSIGDKQVLNNLSCTINPGEVHALMGPNGSGKSSLAYTLMGHPRYQIDGGTIIFNSEIINELSPDKRAKLGMFLALQHPLEIEGVPYKDFLRQAYNALYDGTGKQLRIKEFNALLEEKLALLKIDPAFIERSINVGFSGGEKKRAEVLQLAVLQPKIIILDEIDSGLDIDALKIVCQGISAVKADNPSMAIVLITHYQRILNYIKPDYVHVLQGGTITRSGDAGLAESLEAEGYE